MKSLYWAACAFMIAVGVTGLTWVLVFPPEHLDDAGHVIGEMPIEFGIGLLITALGLIGVLAGAVVSGIIWCWRRRACIKLIAQKGEPADHR